MHTDTVSSSSSVTVSTIADLARDLDAHHMALPAGDPGEGPSERACEVVSLLARYVGDQPASIVGDVADCLGAARPIGGALYRAPIVRRYRSGADDPAQGVTTLHTTLVLALAAAERADVDYHCQAHHDVRTLRAWLAEVALAMPARTMVATCRTREDAERALRAAVTPFGSLSAEIPALILRAADRSAPGGLDALDAALYDLRDEDGEQSRIAIIPHPRSGGVWGTGVSTPTRGALILVARSYTGDYLVHVDFPIAYGSIAQRRPMQIRGADEGVVWSTIGGTP